MSVAREEEREAEELGELRQVEILPDRGRAALTLVVVVVEAAWLASIAYGVWRLVMLV
jgi:hypothetical protein